MACGLIGGRFVEPAAAGRGRKEIRKEASPFFYLLTHNTIASVAGMRDNDECSWGIIEINFRLLRRWPFVVRALDDLILARDRAFSQVVFWKCEIVLFFERNNIMHII